MRSRRLTAGLAAAALSVLAMAGTAARAPAASASSSTLSAGQTLGVNQALWSTDGKYEAIMQGDGNFVVYGPSGALWASHTGTAGSTITMQADGNLVIYTPSGAAVWSSATAPSSGDALVMQTDSNLVIYTGGGRPLWASHTGRTALQGTKLLAGQTLGVNQALWSADGRYEAVMQSDGDFVVYGPSGATWASHTGTAGSTIVMQADGNLVIYTPSGAAAWSSATAPSSNDSLVMQTDGNLVIYSGGSALWTAKGGGASGSAGQAILSAAAAEAGQPYCFDGGNTSGPTHGDGNADGATQCGGATTGFDCTGLTLYAVYQATKITLPHGQGQENFGTLISNPSVSQLQPGDLLLFGSSVSNYAHTGIYIGSGLMWDANTALSPYSDGVQKRAVSWETAANALVGAVRF